MSQKIFKWKAQITQTIPVTIGQTLSILPIGITATVGLSMLASGQVSIPDSFSGYIIMAAKLSGAIGWCFALSDGNLLFGRKN